jgi:hypothetical protein
MNMLAHSDVHILHDVLWGWVKAAGRRASGLVQQ